MLLSFTTRTFCRAVAHNGAPFQLSELADLEESPFRGRSIVGSNLDGLYLVLLDFPELPVPDVEDESVQN